MAFKETQTKTNSKMLNIDGDQVLGLFFLILLPTYAILKYFILSKSTSPQLPPGPWPWPVIGNIPHIGRKLHVELAKMADRHGPLLSLRLGTELMVLGSSPATAYEILKSHDRLLSARHVLAITKIRKSSDEVSLFWQSECGDQWKFLRTLCRAELFSAKAIDAQSSIREKKVEEMVRFMRAREGQMVKVSEIVFATIFNILANIFFSKDFIDLESEEGDAGGLKACFRNLTELAASPNIADFYPFLARYDLQGLGKRALEFAGKVTAKWQFLVQERRKANGCDQVIKQLADFLDVLIANKFTNDQINSFVLELLGGGTDTSTSTIEWAMAELIKNPEAMYKVLKELKAEIKNCEVIRERNLTKLPYLNACIKETLRLHPPAPLLIPHRASQTCQMMNYTVPKDTQIYVNVWAIGRDPKVWKEPLVFNPERFFNKDLDYKGNDFELLPFGAGRRMCPGLHMASRQVHLILASLLANFCWSLPDGHSPEELDMSEKFGVTLQKEQPLLLIPKLIKW